MVFENQIQKVKVEAAFLFQRKISVFCFFVRELETSRCCFCDCDWRLTFACVFPTPPPSRRCIHASASFVTSLTIYLASSIWLTDTSLLIRQFSIGFLHNCLYWSIWKALRLSLLGKVSTRLHLPNVLRETGKGAFRSAAPAAWNLLQIDFWSGGAGVS